MRTALALVATLLLGSACTNTQDLGNHPSALDAVLGQWDGYVEDYQFPSGSDRVTVTLAPDGTGGLAGTLVVGVGDPPPPPTDPNAMYPPSVDTNLVDLNPMNHPIEGIPYTIRDPALTDARLRFSVATPELWVQWCALQTPYYWPEPQLYYCTPHGVTERDGTCWFVDPSSGVETHRDCATLALPFSLGNGMGCACTADGCSLDPAQQITMHLDMAIRGDIADGTAAWGDAAFPTWPSHTLRLTRTR
ncbi:MAG TPA: hypothetical protein VGQ83_32855 [Polyangia bacterium]